jgi:F-type H+-transporting ATPase subunit delta
MELEKIAKSYASALYELSEEKDIQHKIEGDIKVLSQIFKGEPLLNDFLNSPKIKLIKKVGVLEEIIKPHINEITLDFVKIVVQNRRQNYFQAIFRQFHELWYLHQNKARVEVISAKTLPEGIIEKIAGLLKERLKMELHISTSIDQSLIGGFIVKSGDLQIDGSIKKQLTQISEKYRDQKLNINDIIS